MYFMHLLYIIFLRTFIVGLLLVLAGAVLDDHLLMAQSMPDISSINVDELSDAQIEELVRRAASSGLSEAEMLQMAKVRGVPRAELEKLRKRLEGLDMQGSGVSAEGASNRERRRQVDLKERSHGLLNFTEM